MNRRDLKWRLGGAALFAGAAAVSLSDGSPGASAIPVAVTGPLSFIIALLGIVLVTQGKRVSAFWRIERGRHPELPLAIHHRRGQQRVIARRR